MMVVDRSWYGQGGWDVVVMMIRVISEQTDVLEEKKRVRDDRGWELLKRRIDTVRRVKMIVTKVLLSNKK